MKYIFTLMLLCGIQAFLFAHAHHYNKIHLRAWHLQHHSKTIQGNLLMLKAGKVYIVGKHQQQVVVPFNQLTKADQDFVLNKYAPLKVIQKNNAKAVSTQSKMQSANRGIAVLVFVVIVLLLAFLLIYLKGLRMAIPVAFLFFAIVTLGFKQRLTSSSGTAFLESVFAPFSNVLRTYSDDSYFYIESNGIPETHEMMVGISNKGWQQQVPIQQCYTGSNAWPIPLNPALAVNPIPVDSIHFTRGAIAIAANGVPIFNVHTNTGVDSYLDGQLDSFGGHCGRADDYHYHIAPLHLYQYTAATMPIAIALDGFSIYGNTEPNGSNMQSLDENHGHFFEGLYHYHGTTNAPYMIAKMVGKVTEDTTHQLVPQASAKPVRPALTPLKGALILACVPNATKTGYTLVYQYNNNLDSIVYQWNNTGQYNFDFYHLGIATHQLYKGNMPCKIANGLLSNATLMDANKVFPIPVINQLYVEVSEPLLLLLTDMSGNQLFKAKTQNQQLFSIAMDPYPAGNYVLKMVNAKGQMAHRKITKF